ncbi:MAG: DUF3034 family protein [Phycisphaerae bacterium]|nr:DUF3034 family protein [Phycisphaerae bacterium]
MVKAVSFLVVCCALIAVSGTVNADVPLPLHSIEGTSGVFLTSTAYLANPPKEGEIFGKPSFSASAVFGSEKNVESLAVTENILGKFELGYAYERLGLGDWPDDLKAAGVGSVSQHLGMHVFNLRAMVVEEGSYDCSWMPAITLGTHFKWADGQTKLDEDLGGLLDTLGSDRSYGVEFTAVASKTIVDLLPRPIILSAGIRNGDAIHTGFFGFAGHRETTFEGSIIAFLTDRLAFAAEYRQKPDLMNQVEAGGKHLVKAENDWMSLYLAYVIDENTTISGGYANLGNVANHREDNCWGIQLKYEF